MPDETPGRARIRTRRTASETTKALQAQGWTRRSAGTAQLWERPGRAALVTVTVDGEQHVFMAVERWPIEKIATGPMPPL